MERGFSHVCYTRGCSNYATIALKLPLSSKIHCIVNVCDRCMPKYKLDDSDNLQHQHQIAIKHDNGSGAAK